MNIRLVTRVLGFMACAWACVFCVQGQTGALGQKEAPAYPVLDWQYFGSGGGGYYSVIAAAPSQPNRVYCSDDVGGIYRSDDGGLHWYPIYAGLRYTGGSGAENIFTSSSIAISHQNPDVFYFWTTWGGFWKTADGGYSYERIAKKEIPGEGEAKPQLVAINPKSDQDVILYAMGHFHRTLDGGKTIQAIPNPPEAQTNTAASVFYPDQGGEPILWVGKETFYRSMDGGKAWQKCAMAGWPGGPGYSKNVYKMGRELWVSRDAANGQPVLLMLSRNDKGGLYRSRDLGETWQKTPAPMKGDHPYYSGSNTGGIFWKSCLHADPDNADHFGISCGQETVTSGHITDDGGKTWFETTVCSNQPGRYIESGGATLMENDGFSFVRGEKRRVYVCTWFDMFRSDDGGRSFYCISQRRLGKHHYQSTGSDGQFIGAFAVDPNNGFLYIQDDDVGTARSEDFGRTFHMLRDIVVREDKESDGVAPGKEVFDGDSGCNLIVDDGQKPSRLYAWFSTWVPEAQEMERQAMTDRTLDAPRPDYRRGLYYSDDNGESFHWRASKQLPVRWVPLPQALVMDRNSPKDARVFYIALAGGIFTSSDSGRNWMCLNESIAKSLNVTLPDPFKGELWTRRASFFAHLRVDPRDSKTLYVSTLRRTVETDPGTSLPALMKSVDQGRTWQALESPVTSCWALAISPYNSARIYAADGKSGVYFSEDGGKTWARRFDLDCVNCIIPSSRHPTVVYVASYAGNRENVRAGVFRTADHGQTWRDITGNLPNLTTTTMSENPLDPHWVFIGTRGGGAYMAYDFLPDPEKDASVRP